MNIYLIIAIGGVLGIFAHSLFAVNKINKRTGVSTTFRSIFIEYWKNDKLSFLTSCFCFLILMWISSEFVNLNQLEQVNNAESLKERLFHFKLAGFIKTASVIAGYFADSIVYGIMGVTEKRLAKTFDEQGK
jgi:hypothetical protein